MGKRSEFERVERDYYRTFDPRAGEALKPHVDQGDIYVEPCAGDGSLIQNLDKIGLFCSWASDIKPSADGIMELDGLSERFDHYKAGTKWIITNPPWDRRILHPMITKFQNLRPSWLLFDAGWMFTKQAHPYLDRCKSIVTIGRLKWIEGTSVSGKDDCCWYLFDKYHTGGPHFYGRQ